MPVPSGRTGSLLEWAKAVAGSKLIPVPLALKGMLDAWLNFSGSARSRPVPGSSPARRGPLKVLRADCVPTFVTVTVSIPWPTLSMSSRILSPTEMLATEETLMLVSPAFASADSQACVPGLPTAVTVTTSYFSTVLATAG